MKKLAIYLATTLSVLGMISVANAADSTNVHHPRVNPVLQTYLLAQGQASTQTYSNYQINQLATPLRCSPATKPVLSTSVNSVVVWGGGQAIEGVNNTVTLNPSTYVISGHLSAPTNIAGSWDNGASITWQVWCQPKQTA